MVIGILAFISLRYFLTKNAAQTPSDIKKRPSGQAHNKKKKHNYVSLNETLTDKERKGFTSSATILIVDFKDFSTKVKGQNAKDTLLLLNLFSSAVRNSVHSYGGTIQSNTGQSLIALFGVNSEDHIVATKQAIRTMKKIDYSIQRLNGKYRKKFHGALQASMSLHCGDLLIGQIGQYENASLTSLGQALDTAIRLEEIIKKKDAEVIISTKAAACAQLPVNEMKTEYVLLRDQNIPIEVLYLEKASHLPKSNNYSKRKRSS